MEDPAILRSVAMAKRCPHNMLALRQVFLHLAAALVLTTRGGSTALNNSGAALQSHAVQTRVHEHGASAERLPPPALCRRLILSMPPHRLLSE